MKFKILSMLVSSLLFTNFARAAGPSDVPLVPRKAVFGNPEKARVRLSHDGRRLAFVAPVEGVLNVWVSPDDDPAKAKPVTFDKHRCVMNYSWAYTSKHILYTQDKNGDEDDHVYCIYLDSGEIKDLTPFPKIAAQIDTASERFPDEILIGINNRDPRFHDLYRINIASGERKLLQENPGVAGFMSDDDYRVRFAINITPDAGKELLKPAAGGKWETFIKIGPLDSMTTNFAGFDKTGDKLYLLDSRDRNTAALAYIDLKTDKEHPIADDARADISGILAHPTEKTIQAVSFTYARTEWKILDDAVKPDFDYLKTVADGEIQITGRTLDTRRGTVAFLLIEGRLRFSFTDRRPE